MAESVLDSYSIWMRARRRTTLLMADLKLEDQADEQMDVQLKALERMASAPSVSAEDIKAKITAIVTEAAEDLGDADQMPAVLTLVRSLKADLDRISAVVIAEEPLALAS